jgi:hypothetical protein
MFGKEWSSYKIINSIMFLLLAGMLIYVGMFYTPGKTTCVVKLTTGLECSSCGLTRDFYSMLHLHFNELVNVYSLQIFSFFVVQLFARGGMFLFSKGEKTAIYLDGIISSAMLLFSFYPLLIAQD